MNKIKIIGLVCFMMILVTGCSNNEKYDEALAKFYRYSDTTLFFAGMALDGYSTAWSDAIDNSEDFNEVLREKVAQSKKSTGKASDTLLKDLSKNLKVISEASQKNPDEYKEIYQECKKTYSTLSALVEQVHSPSGSLLTFNQNVNELTQEYNTSHDMTKTLLSDNVKKVIKQQEKEADKKDNGDKK